MNIDEYKAMVEQEKAEQSKPQETETKPEEPTGEETLVDEKPNEDEQKPEVFKVGDAEVTLEELQKGYLRQSDYTKKTTELANMRKELKQAEDLYKDIQSNPDLQKQLKDSGANQDLVNSANAEQKKIRDLEVKIASMELDKEVSRLKQKYPDFDEVAVITEASKRNSPDLEFIYKATRKVEDKKDDVDMDSLREQLKKELLAEIKGEDVPPTIISNKASLTPVTEEKGVTMTVQEAKIADGMKMSHEDYIKYRDGK